MCAEGVVDSALLAIARDRDIEAASFEDDYVIEKGGKRADEYVLCGGDVGTG